MTRTSGPWWATVQTRWTKFTFSRARARRKPPSRSVTPAGSGPSLIAGTHTPEGTGRVTGNIVHFIGRWAFLLHREWSSLLRASTGWRLTGSAPTPCTRSARSSGGPRSPPRGRRMPRRCARPFQVARQRPDRWAVRPGPAGRHDGGPARPGGSPRGRISPPPTDKDATACCPVLPSWSSP